MNVGEAKVSALEAVGKLFVVEAEEMEKGRVEVVDVDFSIDYAEANARNLLLEERSRKPGFGGIHGGERRLVMGWRLPLLITQVDDRIQLIDYGLLSSSGKVL